LGRAFLATRSLQKITKTYDSGPRTVNGDEFDPRKSALQACAVEH